MTSFPSAMAVATPRPSGKKKTPTEDFDRTFSTDSQEAEPIVIETPSRRKLMKKTPKSGKFTPSPKMSPTKGANTSTCATPKQGSHDDMEKTDGPPSSPLRDTEKNRSRSSSRGPATPGGKGKHERKRSISRGRPVSKASTNEDNDVNGLADGIGRSAKPEGFHRFNRMPSIPRRCENVGCDGSTTEEDVDISELECL